jgi:protein tyrosine phosphatase
MNVAYIKPLRNIIVAAIVLGLFFLFVGMLRSGIGYFQPLRWGVVVQNKLYRTDTPDWQAMKRAVERHKIKVVVELLTEEQKHIAIEKANLFKEIGVEYYSFSMWGDGIALPEVYAEVLTAIQKSIEQGKPVLVNCAAGVKRTGATIALYRVLIQKYPPQLAYSELKDYCPRQFWDKKLVNHLNSNMLAIASNLYQNGVLSRMPEVAPVIKGD